jgi:uncharacterized membrane protein SirB2
MTSFFLVRSIHLTSVALSITGFVARVFLRVGKPALLRTRAIKVVPHVLDTVLLVSALRLAMLVGVQANTRWLATKIGGVFLYIILGNVALRHGRTTRTCVTSALAAVLVFAFVASVARTHSPLGFLGWL